jgi:hypothetical protein
MTIRMQISVQYGTEIFYTIPSYDYITNIIIKICTGSFTSNRILLVLRMLLSM